MMLKLMRQNPIEHKSYFISPDKNSTIKVIKDLGAAAVLISSLIAMTIGIIIFYPKIILL